MIRPFEYVLMYVIPEKGVGPQKTFCYIYCLYQVVRLVFWFFLNKSLNIGLRNSQEIVFLNVYRHMFVFYKKYQLQF